MSLSEAYEAAMAELAEVPDEVEVEAVEEAEPTVELNEEEVQEPVTAEEPVVDGDLYTVKVDGEEIQVSLDELRNGFSRTQDYTRKTQELAEQRREYEAARDRLQAMDALEEALQRDPDGTVAALLAAAGKAPAGDIPMDPLEAEVHQLKQWKQEQQEAEANRRTLAEIDAVKTNFNDPDLDAGELLRFAMAHQTGDLSTAYKAMNVDRLLAEAEAAKAEVTALRAKEAERTKKVEDKRGAPPVAGGAKSPSLAVVSGASTKPTVDEAYQLALAELGI